MPSLMLTNTIDQAHSVHYAVGYMFEQIKPRLAKWPSTCRSTRNWSRRSSPDLGAAGQEVVAIISLTVLTSVVLHGFSAGPLANRFPSSPLPRAAVPERRRTL